MAITPQAVRYEAYRLLNESTASVTGELADGIGGTQINSTAGVTTFITEAITELCKSCVFWPVSAGLTVNASVDGATIIGVAATPSGSIWGVTDVYQGSTRLVHTSESALRAHDPAYKTTSVTSAANITNWYKPDNYRVNVYPKNTSSTSITVYGAGIPATPADVNDLDAILPDDIYKQLLATYVATKLIMKNVDDPSIAQRLFWRDWYDTQRMKLWMQLDSQLKSPGNLYAIPPVQQAQK